MICSMVGAASCVGGRRWRSVSRAIVTSMSRRVTVAASCNWRMAPSSSRMLLSMCWAISAATASGSVMPNRCALRFKISTRVSYPGLSTLQTRPQPKRDTRRSSRSGISSGGASEDRMICFFAW